MAPTFKRGEAPRKRDTRQGRNGKQVRTARLEEGIERSGSVEVTPAHATAGAREDEEGEGDWGRARD